jgi:hypothetical protein
MSQAAAQLLARLAAAAQLSSICIPNAVRAEHPDLRERADELGLATTLGPRGDEDVLCELDVAELGVPRRALQNFARAPFVLLLASSTAESARPGADALLAGPGQWLVFENAPPGAELLAPVERALAAQALPGEWRAAPEAERRVGTDDDALSALWLAAERDRATLEAIADRLQRGERGLEEARLARERTSAEVARQREAERHELDQARLALLEQRAWVADQANRLAGSQSWRVGHRLVRIGRMLTLRRDRGTDLPSTIARRMEDRDFR